MLRFHTIGDVQGTLAVVFHMGRPFGLHPIVFSPTVKVSQTLTRYGYFLLPIYNVVYVIGLRHKYLNPENNMYVKITRFLSFLSYMVLTNVAVATAPQRMKNCLKYLATFEKFIKICQRREIIKSALIIVYLVSSITKLSYALVGECITNHNCTTPNILFSSTMLVTSIFIVHTILFEMIFMLIRIHSAVSAVNRKLNDMIQQTVPGDDKKAVDKLRVVAQEYREVCEVITGFVKNQSTIACILVITSIIRLLQVAYSIFKSTLPTKFLSLEMFFYALEGLWGAIIAFVVRQFLDPCHRTSQELKRTEVLIRLLRKKIKSDPVLVNEAKLFLNLCTLNRPTFAPYQAVTLDNSLLLKILGFVATFMVTYTEIAK